MHVVHCPHCRKDLRVDRPVDGKRLRCKACGHTFRAGQVGDPPAPPAGEPTSPADALADALTDAARVDDRAATTRRPAAAARRRPFPWPIVIVVLFALGTMGLAVGVYLGLRNPRLEVRDRDDDRVLRSERMDADDARRQAADVQRVRVHDRPGSPAPAARTPGAAPSPPAAIDAGTESATYDPVGAVWDGTVGEPEVTGDEHLRLVAVELDAGDTPDTGLIGATVRNMHSQALRRATIQLTLEDPQGRLLRLEPATVEYAGADGAASPHIRVPWSGLAVEEIRRVQADVTDVTRDGELVVAPILAEQTSLTRDASGATLSGFARNTSGRAVIHPVVICEFLSRDGLLVGSASGPPADKTGRVGDGEYFRFEIRLKTLIPQLVDRATARLAGQETY